MINLETVKIDIPEYYEAFLRFDLDTPKGNIRLKIDNEVCRYIFSKIKKDEFPVHDRIMKNPVTFELPDSSFSRANGFPYVCSYENEQIKNFLHSYEFIYFLTFIRESMHRGLTRIKSIDMYLLMLDSDQNEDGLMKKLYRYKLKLLNRHDNFLRKIKSTVKKSIEVFEY